MARRMSSSSSVADDVAIHCDYIVKLLMLGDSGVGKSCMLLRYCGDSFVPQFISTIGIDFRIKVIDIGQERIKLQIWDTAGQERFRTITTSYYRGAMGAMLVYDISDRKSFNNVRNWMRDLSSKVDGGCKSKILVGNKADLRQSTTLECVTTEEGQALADEYEVPFIETSALSKHNIDEAFLSLVAQVKNRLLGGVSNGRESEELTVLLSGQRNNRVSEDDRCSC